MNNLVDVVFRTLASFFVLLILTRLLGKKQLGQLTIFTYITAIAMGNIAGDMVVDHSIPLLEGITGLALWAGLTFLVEIVSLKWPYGRVILDGEPTIVIKHGELMQRELAHVRLNMDDLTMLLRINNVFSVKEVDYAILEPNGQLSVLKKPEQMTVTRSDLKVQTAAVKYLPAEMIVDGQLIEKNLAEFGRDRNWLDGELRKGGIIHLSEVFLAELEPDGSLFIVKKMEKH